MNEIRFEAEKDLNGSTIIKITIPKVVLIAEELENIKKELLFKFASMLIKGFEKVKGGGMLGDVVVEKEASDDLHCMDISLFGRFFNRNSSRQNFEEVSDEF